MSAGAPRIEAAFGSTRTISMFHIHTKETITITYKKDGKYIPSALKKLNWFLRDWRENKATEMDPKTIDLLWEMHTELGSMKPISIICGYRSEGTNSMLRKTRGGQAKRSYHIRGQAIDVAFPDISAKKLRYSALIRERGGVGYYPTSGIPFVHVDSGPVRAWPRLPRYELALLFPNGHTQHRPASGGPLTPGDVRVARTRHVSLAKEVAAFFDVHKQQHRPFVVAEAGPPPLPAPSPRLVEREPVARREPVQVASLSPEIPPASAPPATPQLQSAPQLLRAGATGAPPAADNRGQRSELLSLASLSGPPTTFQRPPAADRNKLAELIAEAARGPGEPQREATQVAALAPQTDPAAGSMNDAAGYADGWAPAPAYDDDHPEELSYRPFPVAPFLTESASADDDALVILSHPDIERTLDLLDDAPVVLPLRLRPGRQVAQVMWAQEFRGQAVDISILEESARSMSQAPAHVASRSVRTTAR